MHIISTINAKTQSTEDVPVVLVNLGGKRKFLPRAETYKEMQRLVRYHYNIESSSTALHFEVSSWDVCDGENVEVTEGAYGMLAPLLDRVSVVVAEFGRTRVMPTPSATPPRRGDDDVEEERTVHEDLAPNDLFADDSPPRRAAARTPKVESEEEEIPTEEEDMNDSISVQDDDDEGDVEVEVSARQASAKRGPEVRMKEEPRKAKASPVAATSRPAAEQSDFASESSQQTAASTSDPDARFRVFVSGPNPDHRAEFMTRGGHLVRKVLSGVCKTFKLDVDRSKLMLCVPMPDEDGNMVVHKFECDKEETIARSGVKLNSKLVVLVDYEEEDDEEECD